MFNRVFLIVLDGFGIGNAPDAGEFNNIGANTALHVLEKNDTVYNGLKQLGLYNLLGASNEPTISYYTSSNILNKTNNEVLSHYEMLGIEPVNQPYNFFPDGFPPELIARIEEVTGKKVLGNKKANASDMFEEFGEPQLNTGDLIIYTNDESVMEVAGHIFIIKPEILNSICNQIRTIVDEHPEWQVAKVTARPFTGYKGHFERAFSAKDYVPKLLDKNLLHALKEYSYQTIAIGKVGDFFNNGGLTKTISTSDNLDGMNRIVETIKSDFSGLCFANLNDFDELYGHKRDLPGYIKSLKEFDDYLPIIVNASKPTDLLIFTAGHGNDPTKEGMGHTRENVPLFIYSKRFVDPKPLEPLTTLADIGATIAEIFDINPPEKGTSFLNKLQ